MTVKTSYKTDFEGLILRKDYLSRSSFDAPLYAKYSYLCKLQARRNFDKFGSFYSRISYTVDDIELICQSFLISYLSLYSIVNNPKEYDKFIVKFSRTNSQPPTDEDIEKEEKTKIVAFLNQQCIQAKDVINRKSTNILASKDQTYLFAMTSNSMPVTDMNVLIDSYKQFNYRKVSFKEYKELGGSLYKLWKPVTDKTGYPVIVVRMLAQELYDLFEVDRKDEETEIQIPDDTYSPTNVMDVVIEEFDIMDLKDKFNLMTVKEKRRVLKKFIKWKKDDPNMKTEIVAARQMLKSSIADGLSL
jgi:hypothetical protein